MCYSSGHIEQYRYWVLDYNLLSIIAYVLIHFHWAKPLIFIRNIMTRSREKPDKRFIKQVSKTVK